MGGYFYNTLTQMQQIVHYSLYFYRQQSNDRHLGLGIEEILRKNENGYVGKPGSELAIF